MMNYYKYYDKIIRSLTTIRTLQKQEDCDNRIPVIDLEVSVGGDIGYAPSQTAEISECDDFFLLSICGDPIYHIYKDGKRIKAFTKDVTYVEDSIINLPAALYCFMCDRLLLHCSSIVINNGVYALVGNKGLGKTTLSLMLSEHYRLLGDDTLMVCGVNSAGNIEVVPSRTLSKLTAQTMSVFSENILEVSDFVLNSQKKLCRIQNSILDENVVRYQLNGFILLYRTKSDEIGLNIIRTQSTQRLLVMKNIVGIQYFPFAYRSKIINSSLFQALTKTRTYTLSTPEGIEKLRGLKNNYVELLHRIGGKK